MVHFWLHLQVPKLDVLNTVQTLNHTHVQVTCQQSRTDGRKNVTERVLEEFSLRLKWRERGKEVKEAGYDQKNDSQ